MSDPSSAFRYWTPKEKSDQDFEHDVEDVVQAEAGNLFSRHARVLVYINSTLLVSVVFFTGIYYQRFADLERRVDRMASIEVLSHRIDELNQKLDRLQSLWDQEFFGAAEGGGRRHAR